MVPHMLLAHSNIEVQLALTKLIKAKVTCDIVVCENGKQVLKEIVKQKFDLIILDHILDQIKADRIYKFMDGHPMSPNLTTPYLFLTDNYDSIARNVKLSRSIAILHKPYSIRLFHETIFRLLCEGVWNFNDELAYG